MGGKRRHSDNEEPELRSDFPRWAIALFIFDGACIAALVVGILAWDLGLFPGFAASRLSSSSRPGDRVSVRGEVVAVLPAGERAWSVLLMDDRNNLHTCTASGIDKPRGVFVGAKVTAVGTLTEGGDVAGCAFR